MDFSIMASINIKASEEIFTFISVHITSELQLIKKFSRSKKVPIPMDPSNTEIRIVFATVVDAGKVYSNQTGHFSVTSNRGVKCVFILYS